MRCPFCGHTELRVLESRPSPDGDAIRRRRECARCVRRFTTHERAERPRLFVIKRDGSRVEFDPEKVLHSMVVACRKRRIAIETLRDAVERVERSLYTDSDAEVPTEKVGEAVLRELRGIDAVAFVRFASVYRDFEGTDDFRALIEEAERADRPEWLRLDL